MTTFKTSLGRFRWLALGGLAFAALAIAAEVLAADDEEGAAEAAEARLDLPVARIDGEPVTVGYLEATVARQSPLMRKGLDQPDKLEEFLQKMINMELLAAEAERRGYDEHEEVESVLKNQLASLMHRRIAERIEEREPTEEAMREYYQEHESSYNKPEKMRARHILITEKEKAQKLLADVLKKKPSQYEFRRLAQENSEDEDTRLRGGDLTFFPRPGEAREEDPEVPPEVAKATFELKENGEIYPELVESSQGYHLVMRTGRRDALNLSFEDARDRLALLVKREQRKEAVEAEIEKLEERFPVELHEENLKDVVIDLSGGPPKPHARGGLTEQERKKVEKARKAQRARPEKSAADKGGD
jgi:peptidyl-prolyl cis-trans isomerase C